MNRKRAIEFVEQYVESWLSQNRERFLETLTEEVTIRECYEPAYEGKDVCEDWFRTWHADDNQVLGWKIDSFLFDPDTSTVAFEWDFECLAEDEKHAFFVSSHVTFRSGRIRSINEYERTKEQYSP